MLHSCSSWVPAKRRGENRVKNWPWNTSSNIVSRVLSTTTSIQQQKKQQSSGSEWWQKLNQTKKKEQKMNNNDDMMIIIIIIANKRYAPNIIILQLWGSQRPITDPPSHQAMHQPTQHLQQHQSKLMCSIIINVHHHQSKRKTIKIAPKQVYTSIAQATEGTKITFIY